MQLVTLYRVKTDNGIIVTPIKRDGYEEIIYKIYDDNGTEIKGSTPKTESISIQSESTEEIIQADEGTELNVDVSEDSIYEKITEITN
jgi:hypothetical protein